MTSFHYIPTGNVRFTVLSYTLEFKANLKNISNPFDLSELENKIVEISNETVTAKIFEQWNLESELVDAIFYSNNPDDAPEHIKNYSKALKVVKSAVNIFNQLNDDNLQNTLMCLDEYGFAQDKFLEAVAKVKANASASPGLLPILSLTFFFGASLNRFPASSANS